MRKRYTDLIKNMHIFEKYIECGINTFLSPYQELTRSLPEKLIQRKIFYARIFACTLRNMVWASNSALFWSYGPSKLVHYITCSACIR